MTSATLQEQGDTIRYIVNSSPDAEEAKRRYAALEGIDIAREVSDDIFNTELQKKFTPAPPSQGLQATIKDLTALVKKVVEHPKFNLVRTDDGVVHLYATDPETGERMAGVGFKPHQSVPGHLEATMVRTEPKYRGQGMASRLYDAAERYTGKRIAPSDVQLDRKGIKEFWIKRHGDQVEGKDWFGRMPKEKQTEYLKEKPKAKFNEPPAYPELVPLKESLQKHKDQSLDEFKKDPWFRNKVIENIKNKDKIWKDKDTVEKMYDKNYGKGRWFEVLSKPQQKEYIKHHPDSKYASATDLLGLAVEMIKALPKKS